MDIMEKSIIQSNPLIEARKKMNVTEMRFFLLGLQDLQPYIKDGVAHDLDFREFIISPSTLENIFGSTGNFQKARKQIEKAFDGKIIIHYKNGGFELNHIYQILRYEPNVGLHLKFDDMMKPYILNLLNKQYTSYPMKEIFPLTSEYGWRIMELLQGKNGYFKQGKSKVYVELSMEELRFALNVREGSYDNRIGNFKSRVLDIPIAEINEKTNYKVWYETKKTGRRVTGFVLWMSKKDQQEKEAADDQRREQELKDALKNNAAVRALADAGVNPAAAKALVEKHGEEHCLKNLRYARRTSSDNIKNFPGFVVKCIEDDLCLGMNLFDELAAEEKKMEKQREKEKADARAKADFQKNYDGYEVTDEFWKMKKAEHGGAE